MKIKLQNLIKISTSNYSTLRFLTKFKRTSMKSEDNSKKYYISNIPFKMFSSKFAKTEENPNFLLNELNEISTQKNDISKKISDTNDSILSKDLNNFIKQKENILFIDLKCLEYTDMSNTKNSFGKGLKFGQFISLNKSFFGQVLSINEKYFTVLMFSNLDLSNNNLKLVSIETTINNKDLLSKHCDYKSLLESKITSKLVRKYNKRELVEETLKTGQIMIDYINPLTQGTFNLIKGESNHGQEELLLSTIKAFNGKVILITKNNKFVNELNKDSQNINNKVELFLGESMGVYSNTNFSNNKIKHSNEFSLTRNSLIPNIALNKLKELKENINQANQLNKANSKNNILIVFDDYVDFFFANKTSYVNAELYYPAYNIINDLYEECGNFINCDVTALIVRINIHRFFYFLH